MNIYLLLSLFLCIFSVSSQILAMEIYKAARNPTKSDVIN